MISTVLDELTEQLPAGVVVVDPEILDSYRRDRADLVAAGTPGALMRPTSTAEVATSMRWASHHGVTVVARGAGSGLSGGANAIDGCLMISLERMRRVREIAVSDQLAVVEAGVINADLGRAVAKHGLLYPPDPGSFEISTIGGNLATNAGGMRCVKYGVTRTSTLGLEVVLADGRVLHTGGRSIKNVAGLDLTQRFVGSEGTLGIITAATLRLQPAPTTPPATFVATFPTLASAGAALAAITASGASPSVLEFMDHATINAVEDHQRMDLDRNAAALVLGQADATDGPTHVAVMAECCNQAGADFVAHTQDPTEADLMMAARRLAGFATMAQGPSIIEDVAVPRSRLTQMLLAIETISAQTGMRIATVGHAGDGNLHPILMLPDLEPSNRQLAMAAADKISAAAIALGGTITGEHGVGTLKRQWLKDQLDETSLAVHANIKAALDPLNLLNPGRGF